MKKINQIRRKGTGGILSNVEKVNEELLKWLEQRLERANYVERQLTNLIKKRELSEEESKRYNALMMDSKNISIKDIISIYEAIGTETESIGFEDFE